MSTNPPAFEERPEDTHDGFVHPSLPTPYHHATYPPYHWPTGSHPGMNFAGFNYFTPFPPPSNVPEPRQYAPYVAPYPYLPGTAPFWYSSTPTPHASTISSKKRPYPTYEDEVLERIKRIKVSTDDSRIYLS